jgi:hypothetical protein
VPLPRKSFARICKKVSEGSRSRIRTNPE